MLCIYAYTHTYIIYWYIGLQELVEDLKPVAADNLVQSWAAT